MPDMSAARQVTDPCDPCHKDYCEEDHNGVCLAAQPSVSSRRTLTSDETGSTGSWTAQDATHASGAGPRLSQEAGSCSHHTEWRLSKAALHASCALIASSAICLLARCRPLKASNTQPRTPRELCCLSRGRCHAASLCSVKAL